ncbi:MAG: hypothetical protein L0Z62_08855 [Gemmataceae bacterium]|nr:hypothetical protein [Gemmataceae bacterium]
MTTQCLLDAGGYRVAFTLHHHDAKGEYLEATVALSLPAALGGTSVTSKPTFIAVKDLRRFVAYLDGHIASLRDDPAHESFAFVPLELGFQAQALAGEVDSENEGEFTLRFLVNVGEVPTDGGRVYVGAESAVEVSRVRKFMASLEGVAAALPQGR